LDSHELQARPKKRRLYIIFNAFANQVQVKGKTRMQTPPMDWYKPKKATTDKRNRSQYSPDDFFELSI